MTEKNPVVYTPLQFDAISAFARRQEIPREEHHQLKRAFAKLSHSRAWKVVKDYASGKIMECGRGGVLLTRAWFALGEEKFEILFRAARLLDETKKKAFKSFRQFVVAMRSYFPEISIREGTHSFRLRLRRLWSWFTYEPPSDLLPEIEEEWLQAPA